MPSASRPKSPAPEHASEAQRPVSPGAKLDQPSTIFLCCKAQQVDFFRRCARKV